MPRRISEIATYDAPHDNAYGTENVAPTATISAALKQWMRASTMPGVGCGSKSPVTRLPAHPLFDTSQYPTPTTTAKTNQIGAMRPIADAISPKNDAPCECS